ASESLGRTQVRRHVRVTPQPLGHHRTHRRQTHGRGRCPRARRGVGTVGRDERAAGDREWRRGRNARAGAHRAASRVLHRTRSRSRRRARRTPAGASGAGTRRSCIDTRAGLAGRST
ncbi:MAG: Aspartokinase / Diaminopimelate decarboxylase, partial [uncultured Lysobacter sp.]